MLGNAPDSATRNIDSFLKVLIRGLILLAALVINVSAQRLPAANPLA